jgi:hypothetical protein
VSDFALNSFSTTRTDTPIGTGCRKKDLQLLFEARDTHFAYLVEKQQGTVPLIYAMRMGPSRKSLGATWRSKVARRIDHADTLRP